MNEYTFLQQLNSTIKEVIPSMPLEVTHSHLNYVQLDIKHVCGQNYTSLVQIEYLQQLKKNMTKEEFVKTLVEMTKQRKVFH